MLIAFGAGACVQPHQVVEAVAPRCRGLQQGGVHEGLQQLLGVVEVQIEHGCRRRERDVGPVGQAEQAEGACLLGFQLAITQFEGGLDGEIAGPELVQAAALVGELARQDGHRPRTPGGQPRGGDPDGQRQEAAGPDDGHGGLPLRGDALLADDAGEEGERFLRAHHVEVDEVRARQVVHARTAGDQRGAAFRAGQERADLGSVPGVVQERQHAPAGEGGAVEGRAFRQTVGDGGVRSAQGAQEGSEDGLRLGRGVARALQVDVELSVGEVFAGGVRDMDGEGGLPDAADAGEGRDGHDAALGGGELIAELGDEGGASGEVRHGGGQLLRPHHGGAGGIRVEADEDGCVEVRVRPEDPLLEIGERGTGIDAQLLVEQLASVGVDGERLGLSSAAVERQHEEFAQPLAQRVGGGEGGQFGDRLGVAAHFQAEFEAGFQQGQAPLVETCALGVDVRAGEAGQRFALPLRQCGVEEFAGAAAVAGGLGLFGLGRVLLGTVVVEVQRAPVHRPERIAAGLADQGVGVVPQRLAEP